MDGHYSGYHKAATPPQHLRHFLKLYEIFTRLLRHLYDFPPGTCHTPEESFTRAVQPEMAPERLTKHTGHTAIWGRERPARYASSMRRGGGGKRWTAGSTSSPP